MNAVRTPTAVPRSVPAAPAEPSSPDSTVDGVAARPAWAEAAAPQCNRSLRAEVARHYRGRLRHYARVKLRHDPVYDAVADELCGGSAPVLDIGSGIGLLGVYLRARGFDGAYTGIDRDAGKIAEATRAAAGLAASLTFARTDANALPAFSGSVVLLDMLHYLERDQQQALLLNAARRVAAGGVLILRTMLREPRWRFIATVWEEHLLHGLGWMPRARHFPLRSEIESALCAFGFATQVRPLWGATPFASFLIVARRTSLR